MPRIFRNGQYHVPLALLPPCLALGLSLLVLSSCGKAPEPSTPSADLKKPEATANDTTGTPAPAPLDPKSAQAAQALATFNRGAALLEQYKYAQAAETFDQVVAQKPDWTAARFNLGLALLNMQDQADAAEAIARAKQELEEVLKREPDHRWAHFCLGVYHQFHNENEQALTHYEQVYQADPADPYAAYKYAETLINLKKHDEAIKVLEQVVESDQGFVSAFYRLGGLYNLTRQREKAREVFTRFKELNNEELAAGSYGVRAPYSAMGKYYTALTADGLPDASPQPPVAPRIVFNPEPRSIGPALQSWNWTGGAVRLPGVAVGDLDGDGDQDLILCGAGEQGQATAAFNDGAGRFALGPALANQAVSPVLGDVDNDGDLDLFLGRASQDQLFLNDGTGKFNPSPAPLAEADQALTACASLVDLDSDGDLDLLAARIATGSVPPPEDASSKNTPAPSRLLNNNLDSTYPDIASEAGLSLEDQAISCILQDDFDNDRDIDLVYLGASTPPRAWENYRVGRHRWHEAAETGLGDVEAAVSGTTGDPFKSGNRDLLLFTGNQLHLLRNQGDWRFLPDTSFNSQHGALGGTGGQFVDIDNDGDLDIMIPDAHRRDGTRGPELLLNQWPDARFDRAAESDPGILLGALSVNGDSAGVAADFNADGRCDLLLLPAGEDPLFLENQTRGGHWLMLDLLGKRPEDQTALSPNSPIGARVELRAGAISQQLVVGSRAGATAVAPLRLHAGLGQESNVQWLRVLWPDSILQAELELKTNEVLELAEICRRTTSCPHLFAWDGNHFAFVSDFGGVGGLGYMIEPGVYAPPDPTEYVRLPRLQPREGRYVLQVVEPLEEIVYFDEASLIAVDHPAGTEVYPHEMAAVSAPPPLYELFCFDRKSEPVRATDDQGQNVTAALSATDRTYAGRSLPDRRFMGYARPHSIDLDFGDQIAALAEPGQRPIMVLDGWVEYSTSTSNYAASQAGLRLSAPSLFVEREGAWVELLHEVGYPAGINHVMTLDLAGKLLPTDRRLRIATNMDISWDRIYLAPHQADIKIQSHVAPPQKADLHFLGYPREYSPDGRKPNLLDYSNIDRSDTWLRMPGNYTRHGDVTELVQAVDDRFVILPSGDELTLEFPEAAFPPVPTGFQRTFLLRTDSYCKDMDLYTGAGDHVKPYPFHQMKEYPYESTSPDDLQGPLDPEYLEQYNTRVFPD